MSRFFFHFLLEKHICRFFACSMRHKSSEDTCPKEGKMTDFYFGVELNCRHPPTSLVHSNL